MDTPNWFTKRETSRQKVYMPGVDEAIAHAHLSMRDASDDEKRARAEQIREEMTAEVELRPLNAGDMAALNELKLAQDGVKIELGEVKIRTVELALVGWSLPTPLTADTIRQLNPLVFQQIFSLVDVGEGANGSGPPSPAAAEPPVAAQDTAESS